MALLDIDRVGKVFGSDRVKVVALDNVSLSVEPGDFTSGARCRQTVRPFPASLSFTHEF